jgi:hypothetical protein
MFDYSKASLIMVADCDDYTKPLSRVNLSPAVSMIAMDILVSIGWIVLGFVPTLAAMEAAWRIGKRQLALAEVGVR